MNNVTIIEDTRQQVTKHDTKNYYWKLNNINVVRSKLPIGDYANIKDLSIVVDTKKDICEIVGNVIQDHQRFKKECEFAQNTGIKLIILIENNDGVSSLDDLDTWVNPRLKFSKKATSGKTLKKILSTMSDKYGVEFKFCTPNDSGRMVLKLLNLK